MSTSSPTHLKSRFAANLNRAVSEEGIENKDLAAATGINVRLIQLYRAGQVRPRDDKLLLLAAVLRRPVDWFYRENEVEAA